jgi:hypothetical protein
MAKIPAITVKNNFFDISNIALILILKVKYTEASQMCKFIFLLRPRHEINEPRRDEGHEGKKVLERFCSGQVYFFKIGMFPNTQIPNLF